MAILRWLRPQTTGSSTVAKERLRLVLVHNRLSLTPEVMENLRNDMLAVLARYFDVDRESFDLDVRRGEKGSQLISTISVKKRQ